MLKIMEKVDIVFGDDCMGLYVDGELVVSATKLTFGDIIDHLGIRAELWEADLDVYNDPRQMPKLLKDVVFPEDKPFDEQQHEQEEA